MSSSVSAWFQPGIVQRYADDLVVLALLVVHLEQGDRLDPDHAAREGRLRDADHGVERVAVAAQVADQVAVVGRIDRRGGEEAVEDHLAQLLVVLVLVAAPLGDLHVGEELVAGGARPSAPRLSCRRSMRRVVALLAAVLASGLAACGGGGAEPGALRSATLVLDFQPNAVHAGIYAALDQGYYRDAGVDLASRSPRRPPTPRSCSRPAERSSRSWTSTTWRSPTSAASTWSAWCRSSSGRWRL